MHPRYKTPGFATLVMGATAVGFYLVLSLVSENALADSIASLGLAVAFYYGITAFAASGTSASTLFRSARHFFLRGLLPLLGGIAMVCAFVLARSLHRPGEQLHDVRADRRGLRHRHRHAGPRRAADDRVLARLKPFFRGETLNADTPILVPDTGEPPRGGL